VFNAQGTVWFYEYKEGLPEIGYLTFTPSPTDGSIHIEGELYGQHVETSFEEWLNPNVDIADLGM